MARRRCRPRRLVSSVGMAGSFRGGRRAFTILFPEALENVEDFPGGLAEARAGAHLIADAHTRGIRMLVAAEPGEGVFPSPLQHPHLPRVGEQPAGLQARRDLAPWAEPGGLP